MKREVFFAILIGFGIGLLITLGIYQAQSSYKNKLAANQQQTIQNQPSPSPTTPPHQISLSSPNPEIVNSQPLVDLIGITTPNSYLTAVSPDFHSFAIADQNGNFSIQFELESSVTQITLTSIEPQSQNTTQQNITLIYNPPPQSKNSPAITPESDEQ